MGWLYGLTDDEVLEFPCTVLKMVPKGTVEVTEKPVEGGAVLTDHVVLKPWRVSVTVFVSPVETRPGMAQTVKAATELLRRIQEARSVNTVGLPGDVGPYEEMILETFQLTREFEAGNGAEIECELVQLRFARAVVNAPLPRRPRDRRRINRGPQSTTESPRVGLGAALLTSVFGENSVPTTVVR